MIKDCVVVFSSDAQVIRIAWLVEWIESHSSVAVMTAMFELKEASTGIFIEFVVVLVIQ